MEEGAGARVPRQAVAQRRLLTRKAKVVGARVLTRRPIRLRSPRRPPLHLNCDQGTTSAISANLSSLWRAIVLRHDLHIASPQNSVAASCPESFNHIRQASDLRVQCRSRSVCDHAGPFAFLYSWRSNLVLANWVKGLKRTMSEAFPKEQPRSLWQPGFFDHLLRSDESYAQKWEYVRENPVRAGLVKVAEDWPYQGEIVHIDRA